MTRLEALLSRASGAAVSIPDTCVRNTTIPVSDEGPLNARIVVLGESLGHEEALARRNFVGKSGQKLRNHMRLAGIHPDKCRILSVYPFYFEGGSIDKLDTDTLREWQTNTLERLRACHEAVVIVCIGNIALETLTSHRDITRRRGSVYEWKVHARRRIKVVGMIHPAAILHSRGSGGGRYFEKMCRLDWERVKLLSTPHEMHHQYCGCARKIERTHVTPFSVSPSALHSWWRRFREMADNATQVLAIDIETPKVQGKRRIVCISFAFTPDRSLVLPFDDEHRSRIESLCNAPCVKVGHNFVSFDRWWLKREGIEVCGEIRDTMAFSHCLDPASPHSLEFLTSRYTFEQWYKSEAKGHDENVILKDHESQAAYYRYCGLDSCVTIEIHNLLWSELARRGLLDFYKKHYETLYDPILEVMSQGVEIDHSYRIQLLEDLLVEARQARDRLGEISGKPLFTLGTIRDREIYEALEDRRDATLFRVEEKYGAEAVQTSIERIASKMVSNAQLKTLLYGKLGLPLQTRRRKGNVETPTADAVALRRLRLQYAEKPEVVEVLDLAMQHNTVQKLATFFYPNRYDPDDGRFRFTLKLNTEAARLASAAAPDGIGANAQNIPRDKRARRVMLPDTGHMILEADCSQIEGRIVFVRTKDTTLIALARSRTADQHSYAASIITGKPEALVGKGTEERQTAKSVNHAAQRDMRGKTMADYMLKQNITHADGTPYEEAECDAALDIYHRMLPGIRLWQQRVRREVRATKRLVNRWGRIWDVRYEEMNEDLYRKSYNFLPQSECADLTNQCFAALHIWLRTEHMGSRIMMQEHDSLVCSCLPSEAYDVAVFLRDHLEVELDYDGVSLSVPVDFKIGRNWGDCVEIGALTDRKTFNKVIRGL